MKFTRNRSFVEQELEIANVIGVIIDQNLSWSTQIATIKEKLPGRNNDQN